MLDIQGIWESIPHRYPFLLVDRVVEINEEQDSIHGIKNVTANESFFQGHFPGTPIMPGVLMVEAIAQLGAIYALRKSGDNYQDKLLLFRGIEKAKFRRAIVPGDQVHLHAKLIKRRRSFWQFEGQAMVDGEVAVEVEISAVLDDRPKAEGEE